jgi:hypothetical protein
MSKIQKIGNRYISNGDVLILSYFTDSKLLHYCGTHNGEIVGNTITVEEFNTIDEIVQRVKDINIILTEDQAKEIVYRSSLKNVSLTSGTLKEISDYLQSLNKE